MTRGIFVAGKEASMSEDFYQIGGPILGAWSKCVACVKGPLSAGKGGTMDTYSWMAVLALALPAQIVVANDVVVASVGCRVNDPGTLSSEFGVSRGDRVTIETLSTRSSTLYFQSEPVVTEFPARLSFVRGGFLLQGTDFSTDSNARVTLHVEGSLGADDEGFITVVYEGTNTTYQAQSTLQSCRRIR